MSTFDPISLLTNFANVTTRNPKRVYRYFEGSVLPQSSALKILTMFLFSFSCSLVTTGQDLKLPEGQ
jgi:hypothetical protein